MVEGKGFKAPFPPNANDLAVPPLHQAAPDGIPHPPASTNLHPTPPLPSEKITYATHASSRGSFVNPPPGAPLRAARRGMPRLHGGRSGTRCDGLGPCGEAGWVQRGRVVC